MDGSGTIRIEKRDGQLEPFSSGKLTLCLCRVLQEESRGYADARHLCDAIRIYLLRSGRMRVCSAAVFEMALQVLRRIRRPDAADRLEAAVAAVIAEGKDVTYDMKPDRNDPTAVGTKEMADAIIAKMA